MVSWEDCGQWTSPEIRRVVSRMYTDIQKERSQSAVFRFQSANVTPISSRILETFLQYLPPQCATRNVFRPDRFRPPFPGVSGNAPPICGMGSTSPVHQVRRFAGRRQSGHSPSRGKSQSRAGPSASTVRQRRHSPPRLRRRTPRSVRPVVPKPAGGAGGKHAGACPVPWAAREQSTGRRTGRPPPKRRPRQRGSLRTRPGGVQGPPAPRLWPARPPCSPHRPNG